MCTAVQPGLTTDWPSNQMEQMIGRALTKATNQESVCHLLVSTVTFSATQTVTQTALSNITSPTVTFFTTQTVTLRHTDTPELCNLTISYLLSHNTIN